MRYELQKRKREHARALNSIEGAKNPLGKLDDSERIYLKRAMQRVAELYQYWLDENGDTYPAWLPETSITSSSNDRATRTLAAWQTAKKNDDGYLIDAHDHTRRATNRVLVGTWYRNQEQDLYAALQVIVSPLPCDTWGAAPLHLAHWRQAIAPLIEAHARWKWTHAVRRYWQGDDTWNYGGTLGWQMEDNKRMKRSNEIACTGQAILTPVFIKHSKRHQNTKQDTACQR